MAEQVDPGTARQDGAGDRAFEALVAEVHRPVLRYLLRRTDRETAADVLGDTLLALWRGRDRVPPDAALPWAYGVARGCLANARRGERRRDALVARLAVVDPPRPADGPEESLATDDPALRSALARLTTTEAEVVRLWAWEDLTPAEIAVVLGTTPNAVSIRLHRARSRLRALLEEARKDAGSDRTGTPRGTEDA